MQCTAKQSRLMATLFLLPLTTRSAWCVLECYALRCYRTRSRTVVLVMSESENDEPAKHEDETHRHSKGEQLVRDVFAPVRSRQLKRDRPLHGYNFIPPSKLSGNLTILERDQLRTKMGGCIEEDEYPDDDISSFTPWCLK
jgi:hypothetical protein